jgi:hypothetical protein
MIWPVRSLAWSTTNWIWNPCSRPTLAEAICRIAPTCCSRWFCTSIKLKVYRPVYNVQTMTDLETDFVFAFTLTPTLSDSGHLVPMINLTAEVTERVLKRVLTDSGYPNGDDLAKCDEMKVLVFAPWNENSFTAEKRAKAGENGPIRKDEFT